MIAIRLVVADLLLWLLRRVYPGRKSGRVWQIIEVPRRISKTEAEALARDVTDL